MMMLNKTLGERVLERLKDDILSGIYKPGDRLLYTEIASRLEVSMTPVKEALLRLEQEGIVKTIPRKGTYVTEITDQDLIEYTRIRLALESLATDIICEKKIPHINIRKLEGINKALEKVTKEKRTTECVAKDIEFHYTIVQMSENKRLFDLVKQLPLTNFHVLRGEQSLMMDLGTTIVETHRNIISALYEYNPRLARKFLKMNIMPQMTMIKTKPEQ
jgi:DNA-binding GntR family transcriptional regulator